MLSKEQINKAFEPTSRFSVYNEMSYKGTDIKVVLQNTIDILRMVKNDMYGEALHKPCQSAKALVEEIKNMPEEDLRKNFKTILNKIFIVSKVPENRERSFDGLLEHIRDYKRDNTGTPLFDKFLDNNGNKYKAYVEQFLKGKHIGE